MFIATLCTIAQDMKQPKSPSTEKWIKDVVHTYSGILLSYAKEQKNMCHLLKYG